MNVRLGGVAFILPNAFTTKAFKDFGTSVCDNVHKAAHVPHIHN